MGTEGTGAGYSRVGSPPKGATGRPHGRVHPVLGGSVGHKGGLSRRRAGRRLPLARPPRARVIICSRFSAARTVSARSRRASASMATILRWSSLAGRSISRSSRPGLGIIRMFVPRATRSKWRWAGGWLIAHDQELRDNEVRFHPEDEEGDQDDRGLTEAVVEHHGRVLVPARAEDHIPRADEIPVRHPGRPHAPGQPIRINEPVRREVLQLDQRDTLPRSRRLEPLMASVAGLDGTDILESCWAGTGQNFGSSFGFRGRWDSQMARY